MMQKKSYQKNYKQFWIENIKLYSIKVSNNS